MDRLLRRTLVRHSLVRQRTCTFAAISNNKTCVKKNLAFEIFIFWDLRSATYFCSPLRETNSAKVRWMSG
jgi:hypothetical protein